MIVENVRGAQKWVGRSRWNFGSYHLWGDVPALMPPDGVHKAIGSGRQWWLNNCMDSSNSVARRKFSAEIAKIPLPLARHIGRVFYAAVP